MMYLMGVCTGMLENLQNSMLGFQHFLITMITVHTYQVRFLPTVHTMYCIILQIIWLGGFSSVCWYLPWTCWRASAQSAIRRIGLYTGTPWQGLSLSGFVPNASGMHDRMQLSFPLSILLLEQTFHCANNSWACHMLHEIGIGGVFNKT